MELQEGGWSGDEIIIILMNFQIAKCEIHHQIRLKIMIRIESII